MVTYNNNEMIDIEDLGNSIETCIDNLKNKSVEKIAIIKNNKPIAVMIDEEKYQKLIELDKFLNKD